MLKRIGELIEFVLYHAKGWPCSRQGAIAASTCPKISFARVLAMRKYAMTDISASMLASGPTSSEIQVFNSRTHSGKGLMSKAGARRR